MKWFVERGMLGAAFALALIILISVSWLSYTNTRNLIETGDWVTQTHESLENLESVLALLNTIQSAQRGFVLTGEESYLAPYRDSTSLLEGQLAILYQRVSDNPDQSQRFERLKPLLIERISLADEIIEVRRSAGFDAALKIVETDRGKEMTDQIRQLIGEMRETEISILTVRDSQSKAQARQSILTLAVGSSLSFVLLVLVFYFLNREVASRKRAEASMLEQSRLMELILNSTGEGIVVADETGRMILFNPAAERLLGVGLTDKAPEEWTEIYGVYCSDGVTPCPPEDLPLAKAMHGIEVDNVELFLRNPRIPDGVWVTVIGRPLMDDKGNSYGGVVAFHDTTLRKQAENSLQKYADDISDLYNNAPCGYHSLDSEGTFVRINDTELGWLGYTRDEVIGRMKFSDLLTHQSLERFRASFSVFKSRGQVTDLEFDMVRKDGSLLPIVLSATAVRDAQGNYLMSRSTVFDNSERRRAQQRIEELNAALNRRAAALESANKELESFSYSVSHDLRAPLRHIDGFVNMLLRREGEKLDSTSSRYLNVIAEASNRMGRLIDDLLAFSRTSRTELKAQRVDMERIVREARDELSPATENRRIQWQVGELPAVEADASLLRLAMVNLLSNAIKYTGPRQEARIEIGSHTDGNGEVTIYVRDNGVGFEMQYIDKLFGVFQRLHRAEDFEGTGIGLATVRRIIQRHGGRVWAESEVERGASFYFTLRLDDGNLAGDSVNKQTR